MHIFPSRPKLWADIAAKCPEIDTYCTLCARPGQPKIDLCQSCHAQLKARLHMDVAGVTTMLCVGCGDECTVSAPEIRGNASPALTGVSDVSPDIQDQAIGASRAYSAFCSECRSNSGTFLSQIVAPYRYAYPLDQLIKRLKYGNDRQLARVLGTLLAQSLEANGEAVLPDVIVPMPLYSGRLRERGFNQAQDIAHWCGKYLGVKVSANLASRPVDTGSLAGLGRADRAHRILGAFRASDSVFGKHVAIVDDVLTTGASVRELAREIYDSGAASVECWALARTSSLRIGA